MKSLHPLHEITFVLARNEQVPLLLNGAEDELEDVLSALFLFFFFIEGLHDVTVKKLEVLHFKRVWFEVDQSSVRQNNISFSPSMENTLRLLPNFATFEHLAQWVVNNQCRCWRIYCSALLFEDLVGLFCVS